MNIRVSAQSDGAVVSFEKNADVIEMLKSEFPKARWNSQNRVWTIPGKTAVRRAERWSASVTEVIEEKKAAERAAAAECIQHLIDVYGDLVSVNDSNGEFLLAVYTAGPHETISTLMRGIGASFVPLIEKSERYEMCSVLARSMSAKPASTKPPKRAHWLIKQAGIPLVLGVIEKVAELNVEAAKNQAELDGKKAAREKELALQRAALDAVREEKRKEHEDKLNLRIMMPEKIRQKIGTVFLHKDVWRVAEGYGDSFRLQDYHAKRHGDYLKGHEGRWGCYVYCRRATDEEIMQAQVQVADDEQDES